MLLTRCCTAFAAFIVFAASPAAVRAERPATPPAGAKAEAATPTWVFDIKEDAEGTPRGSVSLSVQGRKVVLFTNAIGNYSEVERSEYRRKRIPAKALTACSGWWAGSGEDVYVVRSKGQLSVYKATVDSQGGAGRFRLIRTIRES
ncbi:MAG: hypothetical protein JSR82_23445 [Verrucomicrobia bacterium]|nr:hypothetical protein [Verrucomicrobiota bacterium]